ncbi:NAD-dependent epimerase/dehydratase family protein [Streptomyces sp. st77]|uniref:NAD-dependent epimerase/dehydratase family protein n=1 Tax=Streptomyces sp. st77 TaxID=1828074 RepID=UPI0015CF0898|nr:NAD(P)-dependent oxidoreductase [Streptomyces sp. st77]
MRDERVAVLGGAGYLGTHITRALLADGVQVTVLSRRPPAGSLQAGIAIQLLPQRPSAAALSHALADSAAQVVINAAGATQGDARAMVQCNVRLARNLLKAAMLVPNKPRVVHIGSAAEYGAQPEGSAVTELTECSPAGVYGRTKLAGTEAVLEAIHGGAVRGTVLRIFNPIGPMSPASSVLGGIGVQLLRQQNLPMPLVETGPLDAYRDFVDVRDVASAALLAMRHEGPPPVVNVARGEAVSVRDLVRRLVQVSGLQARLLERPVLARHRSQGLAWQQADLEVAKGELGWVPRYELHESLRDLWSAATTTVTGWAGGPDQRRSLD